MTAFNIIIDTNVLVAALRSRDGASFKLLSMIDTGLFDVAVTVPLVFEYEDVLKREKLGISEQAAEDVLDYVCSIASKHSVYFMWRPYLRDAKDDMVLEAAVAAEATHIVTFNTKDFQGVGRFGVQALWPADFLLQIGAIQ
jgi:putative PIN family toxin of toxin-antitoxin system